MIKVVVLLRRPPAWTRERFQKPRSFEGTAVAKAADKERPDQRPTSIRVTNASSAA